MWKGRNSKSASEAALVEIQLSCEAVVSQKFFSVAQR